MSVNSTDHRNDTVEYESDENRIITYGSFFAKMPRHEFSEQLRLPC